MNRLYPLILLLSAMLMSGDVLGQAPLSDCNCDFVIRKGGLYRNSSLGVKPGQTICVQAGHYEGLRFVGFAGTAQKPIRIINCGGQVTVGIEASYAGVQLWDCQHVIFSGGGDANITYGFRMTRTANGVSMLNIAGKSSDLEVEWIDIARAGFAGIMMKTDPSCDSTVWRPYFSMNNMKVHDNYIHNTGAEGMYLGSIFYAGATITCNGQQRVVNPHLIYGLDVYNNIIDSTGAEGLQYASAPDAKIHHNVIRNAGMNPFERSQINGIQVGSGGGGDVYSNLIMNTRGASLIVLGHLGGNRFFNNVMLNSNGDAIFIDERPGSVANTTVLFANNTIDNVWRDGMRLYNETNTNLIVNNSITRFNASGDPNWWSAGVAIKPWLGATATMANNFTALQTTAAGYSNPASNDFRPTAGSPLVNAGQNTSNWGIIDDINGIARPWGASYDIGAYEYWTPVETETARLATLASTETKGGRGPKNEDKKDEPRVPRSPRNFRSTPCKGRPLEPEHWSAMPEYSNRPEDEPEINTNARLAAGPVNVEGLAEQTYAYPSPCRDQVTIHLPARLQTQRVQIFNATGSTQRDIAPAPTAKSVTVQTGSWTPGVYTYRLLTTDGKAYQGRFVKQ